MKVLITGGAGFIGCNVARFYVKKGDSFRLPSKPDAEYTLIEVTNEKAVISDKSEWGDKEAIQEAIGVNSGGNEAQWICEAALNKVLQLNVRPDI